MSRVWSFYDPVTGIFIGRTFSGPDYALSQNTPSGFKAFEGRHDHRKKRIDVVSGLVIDYEDPASKREVEREAVRAQIADIERSALRAMREVSLDPCDAEARRRLGLIDEQIADLRKQL